VEALYSGDGSILPGPKEQVMKYCLVKIGICGGFKSSEL
jgi:hypothetical protein